MKTTGKLPALVCLFLMSATMNAAFGQMSTIAVDEFGGGIHNGAPVPSGLLPDPFNGGLPGFAYTLPFIYTWSTPQADILVFEPGTTLPSDLLRFTRAPNGPNTLLFFYSDASAADPPDAPADVLGMPNPGFVYTAGAETGLFGNPYSEAGPNGFVYTTLTGPGLDGNPAGTQYTFISEGNVPEPGSLVLLGIGACLVGFRYMRRKRP